MRRSICYCSPSVALAGDTDTWAFTYTTSTGLPKGTKLKFDLDSKGRDIDWEIPSANLKKTSNVIYGLLENEKIVIAKEIENPESFTPFFEFVLPAEIGVGNTFTIYIGSPKETKSNKEHGNRAQTDSQRRRPFYLYIDTSGKGRYGEPEVFSMDIRGNSLSHISVLAPSYVVRNKRFNVIVRFEDRYGNLTSEAPADTLIELSHEHLRENLNWKLFVPETGFISLPNLSMNLASTQLPCATANLKKHFVPLQSAVSVKIIKTFSGVFCMANRNASIQQKISKIVYAFSAMIKP